MERAAFDKLVADTVKATADLLIAKGDEYAGNADRLANFKRNAIKNGQTVLQTWQVYWGKHIDSIHTYMARVQDRATEIAMQDEVDRAAAENGRGNSYTPDASRLRAHISAMVPVAMDQIDKTLSEPIEGRFHDNINYSFLVLALLKELRENGAQIDTWSTPR